MQNFETLNDFFLLDALFDKHLKSYYFSHLFDYQFIVYSFCFPYYKLIFMEELISVKLTLSTQHFKVWTVSTDWVYSFLDYGLKYSHHDCRVNVGLRSQHYWKSNSHYILISSHDDPAVEWLPYHSVLHSEQCDRLIQWYSQQPISTIRMLTVYENEWKIEKKNTKINFEHFEKCLIANVKTLIYNFHNFTKNLPRNWIRTKIHLKLQHSPDEYRLNHNVSWVLRVWFHRFHWSSLSKYHIVPAYVWWEFPVMFLNGIRSDGIGQSSAVPRI